MRSFSVPRCLKGEEWNGTHCAKCQVGHYRNVTGNFEPCKPCPTGEMAPVVGHEQCGEWLFCMSQVLVLTLTLWYGSNSRDICASTHVNLQCHICFQCVCQESPEQMDVAYHVQCRASRMTLETTPVHRALPSRQLCPTAQLSVVRAGFRFHCIAPGSSELQFALESVRILCWLKVAVDK